MARAPLGGSGRAAMTELGWRSRSTLTSTFIIAAGTLAAAHYCSRLHNHCATSPNSGSEYRWGISATQDSRDSDFYSDCHSNRGGVNDSSIGVFSKMPRFPKIFARRRRRHKNGRCGSLLENRRFPRFSWFFMGLGSFEGCQSKKS